MDADRLENGGGGGGSGSGGGGGGAAKGESGDEGMFHGSAHPWVCFFHLCFKAIALLYFLLCMLLGGVAGFIPDFVITTLFIAADFWTVKNVTGRLLVGLRWWNSIDEEGMSVWHFEALDAERRRAIPGVDWRVFWMGLYITPAVWVLLSLGCFFKHLNYLIIVAIAISLTSANIVGYTKCSRDARQRISAIAQSTLASAASHALRFTGGGR